MAGLEVLSRYSVMGRGYDSVEQMQARRAEVIADIVEYGDSDGRWTERNMLDKQIIEAIRELQEEAYQRALEQERSTTYFGTVAHTVSSNASHFVNDHDETFCGREVSQGSRYDNARATCKTCRRAGDAWMRDGQPANGGSAARR